MKKLLLLLMLLVSLNTGAQTLYASPVPVSVMQPSLAVFTANDGDNQPCTLTGSPLVMRCSLINIIIPGKYTLVAKYIYEDICDSTGTCTDIVIESKPLYLEMVRGACSRTYSSKFRYTLTCKVLWKVTL
jgi:hypothetical protein